MAVYEATVTRVRYVHTVIEVEADSPEQAREQAQDIVEGGMPCRATRQWTEPTHRWTSHTRDGNLGHEEYEIVEIA